MNILKIIMLSLVVPVIAYSTELFGQVIKVYDGDTIRIETIRGEKYKIRFSGIDAPESSQECGADASAFLKHMIGEKHVLVDMESIDMYGRIVGTVYFRYNGITYNANAEMLRNGYAWFYEEYSNNAKYKELESKSKENKLGLWNSEHPIKPSEYRKNNKE